MVVIFFVPCPLSEYFISYCLERLTHICRILFPGQKAERSLETGSGESLNEAASGRVEQRALQT